MADSYFPLRWESTGDQWWYASPIDWAAANGHYDLVRELLRVDNNLLIKLTSLRRIRRIETVWDDDARFADAARCRSHVARKLLLDCEAKSGRNTLIRAGYGGWLLYTAASAGDMGFVQELLGRDPLLVFGEGEYGVTDIFYAAARSKDSDVFRLVLDHAVSRRHSGGIAREVGENSDENFAVLKWEMVNRAVHAAARGGNLEILKELVGDRSDILAYRDVQGSTVLHAAAGRGQVEVVKDLVVSFDIINSRNNQGNTALHVAAFKGHLAVVEVLIIASSSSMYLTNDGGNTFLHMAVAGFRTSGFQRLDRQMELMKCLAFGNLVSIQEIINVRNNDGRTVLHMAVVGNVHSNLVELLMTIQSINLNIKDVDGMTALDLLSQSPRSATSEILIRRLISAGALSNAKDNMARSALVSHIRMQGFERSPGTTFKVSDAEIFHFTGLEASDAGDDGSVRPSSCSSTSKSELTHMDTFDGYLDSTEKKKRSSVKYARKGLKFLLVWPQKKGKKTDALEKLEDEDSGDSYRRWSDREDTPTPLRQRFSRPLSLQNNKRTLAVWNSTPSPSTNKKFAAGQSNVFFQATPLFSPSRSLSNSFSMSSISSPQSDRQKGLYFESEIGTPSCSDSPLNSLSANITATQKSGSLKNRLMKKYICFGARGLTVEDPTGRQRSSRFFKRSVLSAA
ncbi:hypothetical protein Taro_010459 [Colocasia esculenta]|uniref:Uncharacterized protein n=1 Tax=Colocasia esculenta TaxID=4460 RepID=A0A843U7M3_COLES|nr:hypothetical protein [Colocasia esculenta]